jgi:uncharacterized hydrophobic protein (TIGR00341 family)
MKKIVIYTSPDMIPHIAPLLSDTLYFISERVKPEKTEDPVGRIMITAYLPDSIADDFISRIQAFADQVDRRIVMEVITPDFIASPILEGLKDKLARKSPVEKPSIERLVEATEPYTVLDLDKAVLAAIAGLVALTGLFLNNVGVIIGAMLISPLLGPIYAFAINTGAGNMSQVARSVKVLAVFVGMIILISILTTAVLSLFMVLPITPEIESRMVANPVYIIMAILLGFATILALSRGIPEGVAGVAVAAALLPPAVVVGIAAVISRAGLLDALVLTLQNIFGLGLGSVLAVTALHIHPRDEYGEWKARKFLVRIAWVLAVIFLFLLVLSYLV